MVPLNNMWETEAESSCETATVQKEAKCRALAAAVDIKSFPFALGLPKSTRAIPFHIRTVAADDR